MIEQKKNLKNQSFTRLPLEYCSYGCAYFVLENEAPKRASFDKKMRKKEEETPSRKGKETDSNQTKAECR